MSITREKIAKILGNVIEPDLKKDIISLGLVKDLKVEGNTVTFTVGVRNPALHNRKRMEEACIFNIKRILGDDIKFNITVVGLPQEKKEPNPILPKVKNIIAVASGKGGVGKSTITANLAIGLVQQGYKVGLVDADIYGPSIPLMFDCVKAIPKTKEVNGKNMIIPVERYGVKILSIGFFADSDKAIVWRGSMTTKAITQILRDAWWGELDYLLIDLPPGTGDIHLTLVQMLPLTGVVIVSTPQEVALADARKGVNMFQLESINVPILGIVENMAYFTPKELPNNKYYIFGKEGAKNLAEDLDVAFLGQIPLVQSIRESGDAGRPAIMQEDTPTAIALTAVCDKVVNRISWRNKNIKPTKKVEITR